MWGVRSTLRYIVYTVPEIYRTLRYIVYTVPRDLLYDYTAHSDLRLLTTRRDTTAADHVNCAHSYSENTNVSPYIILVFVTSGLVLVIFRGEYEIYT